MNWPTYSYCKCGKCIRVGLSCEGDVLIFFDADADGRRAVFRCPACNRPLPEGLRGRDRAGLVLMTEKEGVRA